MISPPLVELIYQAARHAGFLRKCRWKDLTAKVGLQTADHAVLNQLTLSSDTSMTYPSSRLQGLKSGDVVEIGDDRYQVREVTKIADGSETRATLTRL